MKYDELGTRTRTLGCKGEQLLTIVIWRRELYVQQRTRTPVIPVRDWFGRHTCESVRLLVRLSLTVVRFTVSEDQNVPGRSPYRPAAVWRLKGQKSRTPKCRNHFSTHAPTHPSIHPPIHVFISKMTVTSAYGPIHVEKAWIPKCQKFQDEYASCARFSCMALLYIFQFNV